MPICLPTFAGTSNPSFASSGFTISIRDTESNIFARTGDAVGTIAFGTDTENLYVFDGTNFQIYEGT